MFTEHFKITLILSGVDQYQVEYAERYYYECNLPPQHGEEKSVSKQKTHNFPRAD